MSNPNYEPDKRDGRLESPSGGGPGYWANGVFHPVPEWSGRNKGGYADGSPGRREPGWGDFLQEALPAWLKLLLFVLGWLGSTGAMMAHGSAVGPSAIIGALGGVVAVSLPGFIANLLQFAVHLAIAGLVLGGIVTLAMAL